jgi:hypothetical protein
MSDVLYLTVADRVAGSRTDGGTMVGRRDRCWTASIPTGVDELSIGGAGGAPAKRSGCDGAEQGKQRNGDGYVQRFPVVFDRITMIVGY